MFLSRTCYLRLYAGQRARLAWRYVAGRSNAHIFGNLKMDGGKKGKWAESWCAQRATATLTCALPPVALRATCPLRPHRLRLLNAPASKNNKNKLAYK